MDKYIEYIRLKLDERTMLEQLAEESAEFTQSVLKLIRAKELNNNFTPLADYEAYNNFYEELRDLEICLVMLGYMHFDCENVHTYRKVKRWAERLGYNEEVNGSE